MPGFVHEHLRPLMGSAGLHLALLALLGAAALRWTSSQPPPPLAIEGYVAVEQPARPRPATKAPAPKAAPAPERKPEPAVDPDEQRRAAEVAERRAEAEAQAREANAREASEREAREVAARDAAARQAREKAATEAERKRVQEAERKRVAEADAKRKAAEEEARSKAAAEAEARKKAAAEEARSSAEAKQRAERESEMRRQMAAEEEVAAIARSGVMDDYRRMLVQTIERSWIRPPSARAGLECTLYVSQAPGGTVIDVKLGACNGDQAVRESITNAVYRASPLPAPSDPRAFERRLEIVFKPTE